MMDKLIEEIMALLPDEVEVSVNADSILQSQRDRVIANNYIEPKTVGQMLSLILDQADLQFEQMSTCVGRIMGFGKENSPNCSIEVITQAKQVIAHLQLAVLLMEQGHMPNELFPSRIGGPGICPECGREWTQVEPSTSVEFCSGCGWRSDKS
jgi:hypothetical protein